MSSRPAHLGLALRPLPGESVCGDQIGVWPAGHQLRVALADGLGHGRGAHEAADSAIRLLAEMPELPIATRFERCNEQLRDSRGLALALADIDLQAQRLTHAAVGNIRSLLLRQGQIRRLGGARGIVGANFRDLYPEQHDFQPGDWLVMFSDGIREDARIAAELRDAEPDDRTAQALLERWASLHDDAALLLYRHPPMPPDVAGCSPVRRG
ncbi:MAG: SpoIIE family protein phosphatase [Gammaproteobacteria bacterium]|jgi:serine phosphatase RsbU (regulator of sigma subunit)|nr:SpoIIE family protein phosphatase [Gammaproteobacteria bacterium]